MRQRSHFPRRAAIIDAIASELRSTSDPVRLRRLLLVLLTTLDQER